MLFGWDFKYMDRTDHERETRTSQPLINEVTYFIPMHTLIDDRSLKNDPQINGLFLPPRTPTESASTAKNLLPRGAESGAQAHPLRRGRINRLKECYGFVTDAVDGKSRFFHYTSCLGDLFNNLHENDAVEFEPIEDDKN